MKTARFASVVAKCGKPSPHLAWIALEQDRELKAAVAANRVMTIHQIARGGKKDFGTVGFSPGPQTQLLIFPRSLKRFADERIVAIDYDLLANAAKFVPAKDEPLKPRAQKGSGAKPAPVVAFPRDMTRPASKPPGKTPSRPGTKPPKVAAPPSEPEPLAPLNWAEALAAIEGIKRRLKARRSEETLSALSELSERIRERLKPH